MTPFLSISILGCGWLGLPLAKVLLAQGYRVKGSTTDLQKIPVLQKAGIFSFCLTASEKIQGNHVDDFFNSDIVVITLPFRRNFKNPQEYYNQIQSIIFECEKSKKVQFVIFTSSTSIYPENIAQADEDTVFQPEHDRSKVLLTIEKELLSNQCFNATIVRLAGLYGSGRKIGAFLAGQKDLMGAESSVNLVHQDDAVGLIQEIITQNVRGEIFNACSDNHPTRRELYTKAARQRGLAIPEFIAEERNISKVVVNDKVKRVLGYQFLHPDPMEDID
ncbi:MAG: SDR family oxidoreductase [Candidatus Omnitrophica bacterium]|nr:SDR family oxidoreductase [Candidatus Omnitrophota bacterium]